MGDAIDLEAFSKQAARISQFCWQALTVTVKDSKTGAPIDILKGVDGCAKPGDMVALMGPSGSGKTTLLNVLARRPAAASSAVRGRVLLDGEPIQAGVLRDVSTYVEQEDALIGMCSLFVCVPSLFPCFSVWGCLMLMVG
jgi:ABC-type multidrug transport system ATPase subunit